MAVNLKVKKQRQLLTALRAQRQKTHAAEPAQAVLAKPETLEMIGTVEKRRFHSPDNGYCVFDLRPQSAKSDLDERITAVGYIPDIREGDEYRFAGNWKNHAKYGQQFSVQEYELLLPTTQQGTIRYLADVAHGVGPATARKIVDVYGGERVLEKIKEDPGSLRNLPFLKPEQVEQILDHLQKNQVQAELSALICREGITPRLAAKVYQKFGAASVRLVKENAYQLIEIEGIGFKTADQVAQSVGIALDSPFRIKAAVDYVLSEAGNEGHCYLRPRDILAKVHDLLELKVETDLVAAAVDELIAAGRATREGNAVYATALHGAECRLAVRVREFVRQNVQEIPGLDELVGAAEAGAEIEYAPEQKQGIKQALSSPISILTGGPGSGKSTILKAICSIYHKLHPKNDLYLASPTGRAAQRMAEVTSLKAQTIHRLLHYKPEYNSFEYGYDKPLPGPGLVIVDEASMIDLTLAHHLFAALCANQHQVVLVGDIDQLPSVGPGSVLRDLINCGLIPVTKLKFNYRQAGGSKIAQFANQLAEGFAPPTHSLGDYEYINVEDDVAAASQVVQMVKRAVDQGLGPMDYQVLCPMHKGKCGVQALNWKIRDLVNPLDPDAPKLGQFRVGDKVMVVKNHYGLGVFNGNLGMVKSIEKGELVADIDGTEVKFGGEDLEILMLAYASTIHKVQGNEFPLVIMAILRHHYVLLMRNLVYTGMTRAQKHLVLISDGTGLKRATQNNQVEERFSLLGERVKEER